MFREPLFGSAFSGTCRPATLQGTVAAFKMTDFLTGSSTQPFTGCHTANAPAFGFCPLFHAEVFSCAFHNCTPLLRVLRIFLLLYINFTIFIENGYHFLQVTCCLSLQTVALTAIMYTPIQETRPHGNPSRSDTPHARERPDTVLVITCKPVI